MLKTMAWRNEGRLFINVHGRQSPTTLEWGRYVNDTRAVSRIAKPRVLVYSYGGAPDGAQRQSLAETLAGQAAPTALLTNSVLVRSVGVALHWFNRNIKVLELRQEEEAFEYLGLSPEERTRARVIRKQLEQELGVTEDRISDSA